MEIVEVTRFRKMFVQFLKGGKKGHFKRKETILRTDVPNSVGYFFIEFGFVKVCSYTSAGNERIHYIYGPGDVFPIGWSSDHSPMSVSFVAMNNVTVFTRTTNEYNDFMGTETFLVSGIVTDINNMQLKTHERIYTMNLDNAEARVAHELLYLASRFGVQNGEQVIIDLPLTQQELADSIRLSRETTGKILNELGDRGYIILGRKRILVYNKKLSNMLAAL